MRKAIPTSKRQSAKYRSVDAIQNAPAGAGAVEAMIGVYKLVKEMSMLARTKAPTRARLRQREASNPETVSEVASPRQRMWKRCGSMTFVGRWYRR